MLGRAGLLAVLCGVVAGCVESKSKGPGDVQLPRLDQLQPRPIVVGGEAGLERAEVQGADEPGGAVGLGRRRLFIQRYLFRIDEPRLSFALDLLDKPGIPAEQLAVWQANGMDWGRLEADQVPMWLTNLPRPLSVSRYVLTPGESYLPIPMSGTLEGVQRLDYYDRVDHCQPMRMIGGRYQMLMRLAAPLEDGQPFRVEMLPHHYGPRPSLLPRSPEEKMLDGTTFDALQVNQAIGPNQVWLLWVESPAGSPEAGRAESPPDEQADQGEAGEGQGEQSGQGGPAPSARGARPARPARQVGRKLTLGQALMTGLRGRQPVQILLMLSVR